MTDPREGMKLSQLSLYYLVSYLWFGGLGLVAAPELALRLLFAVGNYGDILPRLTGMLMLALGTLVFQIIRNNIHALYVTAVFIRIFLCFGMIWLYVKSGDRLFLTLFGIVGVGVVLTAVGYSLDKRRSST
jgi:uncharacterized protein YjeT (DUF2065 family)